MKDSQSIYREIKVNELNILDDLILLVNRDFQSLRSLNAEINEYSKHRKSQCLFSGLLPK